jgi:hypothetical protein
VNASAMELAPNMTGILFLGGGTIQKLIDTTQCRRFQVLKAVNVTDVFFWKQ